MPRLRRCCQEGRSEASRRAQAARRYPGRLRSALAALLLAAAALAGVLLPAPAGAQTVGGFSALRRFRNGGRPVRLALAKSVPRALPSRSLRRLAHTCALSGLVALVWLGSPAAAQADTLVGNLGNLGSSTYLLSYDDIAQGFTTGSAATLTDIRVKFNLSGTSTRRLTAKLVSTSPTGTEVATLASPTLKTGTNKSYVFTAPANTSLAASTTYYVVIRYAGSGSGPVPRAVVASSNDDDSGGKSGWTVEDGGYHRFANLNGDFTSHTYSFAIRVNGTETTIANTAPTASNGDVTAIEDTAYTFAAADFNFSDTDTGDALESVKITTLPGTGKGTLSLDGTAIALSALPQTVSKADIAADMLKYRPPVNASGTGFVSFRFRVNDGDADSAEYTMTVGVTAVNDAPTVANAIPDRSATPGTAFSYTVPAKTFSDADSGTTLTYSATKSDGTTLPTWLRFNAATRTFSGTPAAGDVGTVPVKVTASDGSLSVSDTFDITVGASTARQQVAAVVTIAAGTTPVTEGTAASFTLSRTGATTAELTVNVSVSEAGEVVASANEGTKTATFSASSATATLSVATVGDSLDEDNSVVTATVSADTANPSTYTVGTASSATVTVQDDDNPPTVSVDDASAEEGDGVTFTATLSAVSEKTVTVKYATSRPSGTTAEAADFTAVTTATTLTFDAGETEQEFTIATTEDTTDEDDETFRVTLSSPSNVTISDGTGTGTIEDDDDPPTVDVDDASANEGDALTFTATLSAESEKRIAVTWTASVATGDTAKSSDLSGTLTSTLTFLPSDIEKTFTVSTREDNIDERDETFTVTLSGPSNVTVDDGTGQGTIEDDDDTPTVTLRLSKIATDEDDGTAVTVTASLDRPSTEETTVTVSFGAVSPAVEGDFSATANKTLTIAAETTASVGAVSLTPVDNETDAPVKEVTVSATAANNFAINDPSELTLTIEDDDPAPVAMLVLTPSSIRESDDANVTSDQHVSTVTVQLDRRSSEATTVTVSAAAVSPAVAGDFTLSGNTLTVAAGSQNSTGTVTVTAVNNNTDAPDKTVTVSAKAANSQGVRKSTSGSAGTADVALTDRTLIIEDEDPAPTVTLVLESSTIQESDDTNQTGDEHKTTITAALNHLSSEATTITVAAQAGDFTVTGGNLTIAAGATSSTGTVTITAVDNNTDAPDKVRTVLASARNTQGIVQPGGVRLTIEDDEPPPTVTLVLSSASIVEDGRTATVKVTLSHPSSEQTTVTVSAAPVAPTLAVDFTTTGTVLSIPAGSTESTGMTTVRSVANDTDAPDKEVTISATVANTQGYKSGTPADVTLTVTDDEPPPTVRLHLSESSIGEDGGAATVSASLSHPSSESTAVTVSAAAVSPAVAGDFTRSGALLTIPAGLEASTGTVTITANDNDVDAADKRVTVSATAVNGKLPAPSLQGNPANLTLRISDDDERGVSFDPATLAVRETGTTSYDLALTSEPSASVTVTVTAPPGLTVATASSPQTSDFAATKTLTFTSSNWSTAQTVTVSAVRDSNNVSDSRGISHSATGGGYAGVSKTLAVTVLDSRGTAGVLLTVDRSEIAEGGGAAILTVTISLGGFEPPAYRVELTAAAGTASTGDFTVGTGTVLIGGARDYGGSYQTTATLLVTPVDDGLDESDETITVTATVTGTGSDSGAASPTVTPATVRIVDDDTAGVTVTPVQLGLDEGASRGYTVALDSEPTGDVTVTPSKSGDADIAFAPATLTFTASNWSTAQTVTVSSAEDGDALNDQATIAHAVSGADYGANRVRAATVQVTAQDNDGRAVRVSSRDVTVAEGGTATYTVVLNSLPTGTVTVRPSVTGDADITASPASLSFTTTNWATAQTVTVSAARDGDTENDLVSISHAVSGADYGAANVPAPEIRVTATDSGETANSATLSVSPSVLSEASGGVYTTVTLTVTLEGGTRGSDTQVTVSFRGGTAAASDFIAATEAAFNLTIPRGQASAQKAVYILALDDRIDEDDETILFAGTAPGLTVAGTQLTIEDDGDARGITVSTGSLAVTEQGEATYTVRLASQPTGTVTVTPSATGDEHVTVEPTSLEFNARNWSTAQTVTVRALDDADGDSESSTVSHAASGADYAGVTGGEVALRVADNDRATAAVALTVVPERVEEDAGATAVTVTATLDGAVRTADTEVAVSVTGGTAAAADFAAVAPFTIEVPAGQKSATGTLTLTPIDDSIDEGDESISVGGSAAGLRVNAAQLTLVDDDDRSVTLSATALTVDEESDASYTLVLDTEPTGTVTVRPSVSGNSDVTVSPSSLAFTPQDWNAPQTVTVSAAADDDAADDTASVRHVIGGADYGGVLVAEMPVGVRDNDTRGVTMSESGVELREGGSATYTVVLDTRPTGTVTVTPTSTGDSDVTVSPSRLSFTTSNWKTPKRVTVRAAQDADEAADDARVAHAVTGADYGEASVTAPEVSVRVSDDDIASTEVRLSLSSNSVREGGGRTQITVTGELDASPGTDAVAVTLTLEGVTAVEDDDYAAAGPVTLTIRAGQVRATARVAIAPVNDRIDEGDGETLRIRAATDSGLSLSPSELEVTIADDDTRGVALSRTSLRVNEAGSATYTVRLNSQPTGTVTVRPSVTGDTDVTVSPTSLSFTADDWSRAQTVTVAAADDADGDGDTAAVTHAVSGGDYGDVTVPGLAVSVNDNDPASRTVRLSVSPDRIDEDGGARSVTVTAALDGAARAVATEVALGVTGGTATAETDFAALGNVTVTIPAGQTEGTRTFSFSPVDDDLDEGLSETVVLGGTVPGLSVRTATLTLVDDDGKGIELSQGPVRLTEEAPNGGSYTVSLATQPTGNVTVWVTVSGNSDVTVSPSILAFTPQNWNQPQTVTVSAAADDDAAADTASLRHSASGGGYNGVSALALAVEVDDDDTRGVTVSGPSVELREGGSATYTVVLDTRPTGTVTVTPSVTGDSDVTVSPSRLSFTTSNWKTPKTVTVRAAQDLDETADNARIAHAVSGADYGDASVTAPEVSVEVSDDDIASTEVRLSLSSNSVREGGGRSQLTVTGELDASPGTDAVAVTLTLEGVTAVEGDDYAAAGPVTLTIPAGQVRATARVAVTPVSDRIDEGHGETLRIRAATDSGLSLSPSELEVTIADDDTRGVALSRTSLQVHEAGSGTYTVRLNSQPTGTVTVTPTVTGDTDVTVSPSSLAFTADDWSRTQTVTVAAAEDADGDHERATIGHTASGGDYGGVTGPEVSLDVRDDDPASRAVMLAVSPTAVTEDGGARSVTVTATLDGAVRASATEVAVSVAAGTAGAADFTAVPGFTVTIPAQAASASGTFRFEPVADSIDEGNGETVSIAGTAAGLRVSGTSLTIADDDGRGLVVVPGAVNLNEGGSATVSVSLATQPTGNVTVRVTMSGNSDVTAVPSSLAFTAANWNEPQEVRIAARRDEDDAVDEASIAFAASGADYGGVDAPGAGRAGGGTRHLPSDPAGSRVDFRVFPRSRLR